MNDLILEEKTAKISDNLLNLLKAKPGDRVSIGYSIYNDMLLPTINLNQNGNKISKKLTFIFTGQQKNYLLQYGNIFEAIPGEIIYLKGNNPEFKTFTTVQKAVEYTLSKEIITNTNFNIKQIEYYEF